MHYFLLFLLNNLKIPELKNKVFTFMLLFFLSLSCFSQKDNSRRFINDMLVLSGRFARPVTAGAGYQNSAGWFNSSEVLEPWGLRLSFQANALFVPSDKKSFTLKESSLSTLGIEGFDTAVLPTAFGGATNIYLRGTVIFQDFAQEELMEQEVRFKAFDGVRLDYVPSAFLQGAIGLPAETELVLRGMPETKIGEVAASTFGIGLKHNIDQYFGRNRAGNFDFAIGAAYSKLKLDYEFAPREVENYLMMNLIEVDADLFLVELIGSRRWQVLELFAAVGAMDSKFNYHIGGDGYALAIVNSELEALADDTVNIKGDVGFNLHFGSFRFSTTATFGDFYNVNAGLHLEL